MAALKDIMAYVIDKYPPQIKSELSNARLTKIIYLSDWHHCLNSGCQLSPISWYFDNFGPFVRDVEDEAVRNSTIFAVNVGKNSYGSTKKSFSLKVKHEASLSESERESINHIIGVTSKLYWDDFIKLVYSTYPIASSERYEYLDLVEKAREYKVLQRQIA